MAEETTDKSIVVWHPRFAYIVPDIRELTSLCLFHDQVVFCSASLYVYTEKDSAMAEPIRRYWERRPDFKQRVALIETIQLLAEQSCIRLIVPDDYQKVTTDFIRVRGKISSELWALRDNFWERRCAYASTTKNVEKETELLLNGLELAGTDTSYMASKAYCYPLVTDYTELQALNNNEETTKKYAQLLAQSAICQLALPDVKATNAEDILEARTELRDELLEFRAGILKLTWLLYQRVENKNDLEQIRQEAGTLVNTIIKGSLLSLENRMRRHKKKRIRRMLFGTGRVLVEATKLFLPSGAAEKMISGGKSFFQLATEIDNVKPPEDQVAMYLYKLKGKLS